MAAKAELDAWELCLRVGLGWAVVRWSSGSGKAQAVMMNRLVLAPNLWRLLAPPRRIEKRSLTSLEQRLFGAMARRIAALALPAAWAVGRAGATGDEIRTVLDVNACILCVSGLPKWKSWPCDQPSF